MKTSKTPQYEGEDGKNKQKTNNSSDKDDDGNSTGKGDSKPAEVAKTTVRSGD